MVVVIFQLYFIWHILESPKPGSSHKREEKPQTREKKVKIESLDDGIDCLSGESKIIGVRYRTLAFTYSLYCK